MANKKENTADWILVNGTLFETQEHPENNLEETMKKHPQFVINFVSCMAVLLLFGTGALWAQLHPDVGKWGYADTIFVNGKVVSMDDRSNSTQVGNVYQALAVKRLGVISGHPVKPAADLIEATSDMGAFVLFSGMLKRTAVKLSVHRIYGTLTNRRACLRRAYLRRAPHSSTAILCRSHVA